MPILNKGNPIWMQSFQPVLPNGAQYANYQNAHYQIPEIKREFRARLRCKACKQPC